MGFATNFRPPVTAVDPVTDILHGVPVTDPYRWLEAQDSPQTREWLDRQTKHTRAYFASDPMRTAIRQRVSELVTSVPTISQMWHVAGLYFFLKRLVQRDQPAIVMREGLLGKDTILVDPTSRPGGPANAVSIISVSKDGLLLAYSIRRSGADHSSIEFFNVALMSVLPDQLPEGLCCGLAFSPDNSGFYYSHRALKDPRPQRRVVLWHRFGTDFSADKEIFVAGDLRNSYLGIFQSEDADVLVYRLSSAGKSRTNSIYLHYISDGSRPRPCFEGIDGIFLPLLAKGRIFARTNFAAPNFRVVAIDPKNPGPADWLDVVPESNRRIRGMAIAGNRVFVTRVDRFSASIEAFSLTGQSMGTLPLPPNSSADFLNETVSGQKLFYTFSSAVQPPVVLCYDFGTETSFPWDTSPAPFDPSEVATEETSYKSTDGVLIPLFLSMRKDLSQSRCLPTFITGYGGFGNCATPRFGVLATFLIEQGVLFAVPALRGGSELGESWHLAGRRGMRQQVFNDFTSCAEWLLSQGRSLPGGIAIGGGSNGGLLIGAAITQRPELYRAAICLGPLLDMIRYHLFDLAADWSDEYGSPDDEEDFRSLLSFSPYHHINPRLEYPAVMLISGDADTRCNPMHARKMTARLQSVVGTRVPILLDYDPRWGHMPVQPIESKIEALTNRLTFLCRELGIAVKTRSTE